VVRKRELSVEELGNTKEEEHYWRRLYLQYTKWL
jgi:hypothetical protein